MTSQVDMPFFVRPQVTETGQKGSEQDEMTEKAMDARESQAAAASIIDRAGSFDML